MKSKKHISIQLLVVLSPSLTWLGPGVWGLHAGKQSAFLQTKSGARPLQEHNFQQQKRWGTRSKALPGWASWRGGSGLDRRVNIGTHRSHLIQHRQSDGQHLAKITGSARPGFHMPMVSALSRDTAVLGFLSCLNAFHPFVQSGLCFSYCLSAGIKRHTFAWEGFLWQKWEVVR